MFPELQLPDFCKCGHVKEDHARTLRGGYALCAHACRCSGYVRAHMTPWWFPLLLCLLMVACLAASGVLVYRSFKHGGF